MTDSETASLFDNEYDIELKIHQSLSNYGSIEDFTRNISRLAPAHKVSVIIIGTFISILIICGICAVFGLMNLLIPSFVWMIILLLTTDFGAAFGAFCVYKYKDITEYIYQFRYENKKYQKELKDLNKSVSNLKREVRGFNKSVRRMKKDADKLERTMEQYKKIQQDLEEISDKNKDIGDVLDELNLNADGLMDVIFHSRRAALLTNYYEVYVRDNDNTGLSEDEYTKLLGRLTTRQRKRFNQYGSFKELAGSDDKIDLTEFQTVVDKILMEYEEEMK